MIVSEVKLYNFRRFRSVADEPGLSVTFHKGLNALIGENDSGKTAVIDAIKLVLLTQGNEYLRVSDEDFYTDETYSAEEFRIDVLLSDFSEEEAKNFVEYLVFKKNDEGTTLYFLYLHYRAWKENGRVFTELRAGESTDGVVLEGKARELLKCVYLRPLRDAEREMSAGRNSRISQILFNHPVFRTSNNHRLLDILRTANDEIERFFIDEEGKAILTNIRKTLEEFNEKDAANNADFKTADIQLKSILESLSLSAPEYHPGLGELNLLFIAAELLLLQHDDNGGLRLALIEELEAHLHPQAQLRLIQYLQREYQETGVQIIISTHSTILASKINLKNIILLKNGYGFDLAAGRTGLDKGDYLFLQRFLDATKANLFFAKGVIMVEGDAENILIPVIADIIGYPLERHGVSIVNVGSTAFLRYSRIFIRSDDSTMSIPVAVVTDCDIKPEYKKDGTFDNKSEETKAKIAAKESTYNHGSIHSFVSPLWTFEYCLAMSCLKDYFHKAIHYGKKVKNSDKYALTNAKIARADESANTQSIEWSTFPEEEFAFRVYDLMLDESGKSGLKAIVAQCLASMLRWEISVIPEGCPQEQMFDLDLLQFKINEQKRQEMKELIEGDQYLEYIVNAIKYAIQQ